MSTFISEDLAVMISVSRESLLKYIWQPSVLSIEMVGTCPSTYVDVKDIKFENEPCDVSGETTVSK